MKKIIKDTTLAEILEYSGAEKVLAKYKLPCLWCPFASLELEILKIGQVCEIYEINLDKLLKDLNKLILNSQKRNKKRTTKK